MTFLWALLTLVLHVLPGTVAPAHAQGSRKDDIVFNSRGIPLAGATVRVCAMPASGQPCTPLALIYSDAALTQALANPTTTDGLGNYFFYAAPGKYEIEISGPSITTKQIPNVTLPNDPSSPTFSGGINAFSLTLSGNLTVSGNTTVSGNLASGTLNLTNQSNPPGSAGSGTVNLYTKTADKRLYYKDDTGTELGPLGAGAQTNVINTFSADQNFDGNTYPKGPNPYIDMARYGGYFGTNAGTTASCSNGSANVTLTAAQDFLDATKFASTNVGNGIVLYKCGAATTLSTPPAPTVTVFGLTGGSTTYNYQYVAEDTSGGLTAASSTGSSSTGAATLGLNSVNLTAASWSNILNGENVYTCSANPCPLSPLASIYISGFTNANFNGNYTIAAVSTNTFTVFSPKVPAVTSETHAATAQVLACNVLTMPANAVPNTVENGASDIVMRWFVYRNGSLAFIVPKRDPYWEDCGVSTPTFPPYVPASPGSAVNKYLATTIVSGGGTTSIVVANNAGNTIGGVSALHDNSQNLRAALAIGVFNTPVRVNGGAIFNAATVFDGAHGGNAQVWLPVGAAVNQPWVVRTAMSFKGGENRTSTSFTYRPQVAFFAGQYAYPGVLGLFVNAATALNAVTFENINFTASSLTQIPFVYDQNGAFGLMILNTSFGGSNSSSNLNTPAAWISGVTHSVFGRDGDEWSCSVPQTVLGPPCMRFTSQSPATAGTGFLSVVAHSTMHGGNMQGGTSFQFDSFPCYFSPGCTTSNSTGIELEMKTMLGEERWGPFVRIGPYTGTVLMKMSMVNDDAPNNQPGNGFIDAAASGGGTYLVDDISSSVTGQVLLSGPGYVVYSNLGLPIGTTLSATNPAGGWASLAGTGFQTSGANAAIQAFGAAGVGYGFATPNAPTIVTGTHGSCASNCVASGTYYYAIVANDVTAKNSSLSPCSSSTTVDGTQTITVSWTPIQGQYTTERFRGSSCAVLLSMDGTGNGINGTSYVDLGSYGYSAGAPVSNPGNAAAMNSSGLSASQLTLVSGGFSDSVAPPAAGLSANRTQTLPDVTGYIPVTSYINSAYDNATRANGVIGVNWTLQQNGFNITSNQIQGTSGASSNTAYWNSNPFSPVQFSQVTVTALNGASDYPGVTILASGTGSSSTYYDCVENNANIYIQRVVNTGSVNLTSAASSGAVGDILRLEIAPGGSLTCYKNGAVALTASDTQITSGAPGLLISGAVATVKNWSGGNLHPLAQLDAEQDWTRTQHFVQGIALGGASSESLNNNPRAEQNLFLPGALTSTWTGSTWTNDKAVTITRIQVQAKTAPSGCTTNAVVRFTDGTMPVNVTISAAANDSGSLSQNYAAGSSLQISVQTAAAGCTTSPADANVTVQYRMQ